MASGLTDLRLACRTIRRRPALSAAVVLPIGLAIAVNCALFAVTDGLLFRPLPFRAPGELVAVDYQRPGGELPELAFSARLEPERDRLRADLESSPLIVAAAHAGLTSVLGPGANDLGIRATGVDSRFFGLLGLEPALGRDFTADDEQSTAALAANPELPCPVIIGHRVWRNLFGGDSQVLGTRQVAGRPVRIVGVMGPGVKFPGETDVWVAVRHEKRPPAYVRLAPGGTVEQLSARFPMLAATPLADANRPGGGRTLLVLFAAAGLLLLVAWVQVAGLVFSSAIGRVREMGVRLALGAGRLAFAKPFVIESGVLAGSALLLAWALVDPLTIFVVRMLPRELSAGQYLTPDGRTFAFASAASFAGLALLTAIPVVAFRRASPLRLLEGHVGRLPFAAERLRHGLLVVQVTVTALLLYVAGLMVHSFVRAASFDYGFESRNVLLFTPPTGPIAGDDNPRDHRLVDARLDQKSRRIVASLERLHDVPGVIAAAAFSSVPLVTRGSRLGTSVPGRPRDHWESVSEFDGHRVSPALPASGSMVSREFIRALGATLVAGRGFDDPEDLGREDIIVINETLARQLAPAARAGDEIYVSLLGRTLRTTWSKGRIVGVIKNLVYSTPSDPVISQFFVPAPNATPFGVLVIRTARPLATVFPAIQTVLQRVWGDLPPKHFARLRDAWHAGLAPFQGKALLLTLIAVCCLPLAAVGLTGALLFSVQVRTRDTAIRIALGADPHDVWQDVVRSALMTVGFSLTLGIVFGVAAGRTISHHLFQVYPADVETMVAVASGMLGLAWLAALLPARRASRLEPAAALRAE